MELARVRSAFRVQPPSFRDRILRELEQFPVEQVVVPRQAESARVLEAALAEW